MAQAQKISKTKTKRANAMNERFSRIARMINSSVGEIKTMAKRVEDAFKSVGKVKRHADGRITVFATKHVPMTFTNSKHVVKLRALVKDGVDCPLAKCGKDPDSCWLGAFATSVHVGNVLVTFWSELCPHITVKAMLPQAMRDAVRDWDAQVLRKAKNRRFNLDDGTYFLSPCPPSLAKPGAKTTRGPRGKNTRHPTRRMTVRSDITLAIAAAAAVDGAMNAASKSKKAS